MQKWRRTSKRSSGKTTQRRSQDTSLSRSKKRAIAGHRQGDGKRALAKQSIIQETFERERERWDRLFFCRKPIPTISFERGMVKKAGTGECDGNKKKEKEKWRGKRGERKRSATLTRVLKSSSYVQPAPSLLRPLDQLATSCVPPLTLFTFLGVRELIRVPYFSRLQRLPNINRRKRQGRERDRKRTSFFPS